ncbi:unnamed protein product [Aphis gossypii]|uniref:Uncharacterized protein n=1 Tax=Aphis gossypii TaxID=80765 RepID=A0A9P0J3T8_APHGO|nr:unnamed protein product [Aphis gossypii]
MYICIYVRPRCLVRRRELAPVLVCARIRQGREICRRREGGRRADGLATRGEGTATGTLYVRQCVCERVYTLTRCRCVRARARERAGFGVSGSRVRGSGWPCWGWGGGRGCVLGARVSEGEARDSAAAVYNSSVALATFRVQYLSFFFFFFLKQFFRFPRLPIYNNYNKHIMFRTISIAL